MSQLTLLQGLLVGSPAMEALGEAFRLLVLQREEELTRPIWLLDSHVLNVHLECNRANKIQC